MEVNVAAEAEVTVVDVICHVLVESELCNCAVKVKFELLWLATWTTTSKGVLIFQSVGAFTVLVTPTGTLPP